MDKQSSKRARYVEIDTTLDAALEALARVNHRTYRAELEHAIQRHLAAPPTVRVVTEAPDLAPAEITPSVRPPSRRGRPRRA
ncbi:MAG: hypothetical protein SNJ75_12150 [Gemmataceae bacterium]